MIDMLRMFAVSIDANSVNIPKVGADKLLPGILSTVYWTAGVAAVIVIVVAGIFYSISEGEAAKIKRAREAIIYALAGLVVVMVAFTITNFIAGRF
jgi:hypothetical protein